MKESHLDTTGTTLLHRRGKIAPSSPTTTSTTTPAATTKRNNTHHRVTPPLLLISGTTTTPQEPFQVLTTFTDTAQKMIPSLLYDLTRKQFHLRRHSTTTSRTTFSSLLGHRNDVADKIEMLAQRYALLYQRTLRHELFRPTSIILDHNNNNNTTNANRNHNHGGGGPLKLTPIESLLGTKQVDVVATNHQQSHQQQQPLVLLFGILLQIEENVYYLEDMTGQIPISFQQYHTHSSGTDTTTTTTNALSFFLTEHSMLLVEGYYNHNDGMFYIVRCGPPLQETRAEAGKFISQQISHPAFQYYDTTTKTNPMVRTNPRHGNNDLDDTNCSTTSFLLLQDLYMDQPRIVQQFEALLSSYEFNHTNTTRGAAVSLPIFVLMGNFMSSSSHHHHHPQSHTATSSSVHQTMKSMLEELIGTIGKFTFLAKYGHFIIVPGPNDIAMTTTHNHHILPIPSFPKSMIHGLQKSSSSGSSPNEVMNLHFTSNPCRIRFTHAHRDDHATVTNKEMVIFRYDLLQLFQQHQIRLRTTPPTVSTKHQHDNDATTMNVDHHREDDEMMAQSSSSSLSHNRRLLYKTILDQGCLIPISNVPIYWSYSHCLSLYPLPSCLVLADGSTNNHTVHSNGIGCTEQYDSYHDCDIIQTISFSNHGNDNSSSKSNNNNGAHTIYRPTTSSSTHGSDDTCGNEPDDSSHGIERIVEFSRVG